MSSPECLCFNHSPHLHTELFSTRCLKSFTHVCVRDSQDASREEKKPATSSMVLALFDLTGDSLFSDKWSEFVLVQRQQCAISITNHLTEEHSGSREGSGQNGGSMCEIYHPYLSVLQFSESVSLTLSSPTVFPSLSFPQVWPLRFQSPCLFWSNICNEPWELKGQWEIKQVPTPQHLMLFITQTEKNWIKCIPILSLILFLWNESVN